MKLKRANWAPSDSYALCSCHFAPEDFTLRLSFGNLKCQRTLIKDNLGVLPVSKFQRNSWGEEDLSDQSRRQVSHATLAYNHSRFTDVGHFNSLFFSLLAYSRTLSVFVTIL